MLAATADALLSCSQSCPCCRAPAGHKCVVSACIRADLHCQELPGGHEVRLHQTSAARRSRTRRTYKACTVGTSARPPSTQEDSLKGEYRWCESTQGAALQQMPRAGPLREDVPQCTCKSTRVRLTTTLIRLTIAHATYRAGAPAPVA